MSAQNASSYRVGYVPDDSVKRLSAMSGLFGRRNHMNDDVSTVFSGNTDDTKDYAIGLIVLGSITLAIFLLWSLILGCCMCCGRHRVGYCSGRPFMRRGMPPEKYVNDDDEFEPSEQEPSMSNDDYHDEPPEQARPRNKTSGTSRHRRRRGRRSNVAGGDKCGSRPSRIRFFFILCGCVFITFSILLVTQGITNLQTTVDTMNVTAKNVNAMAKEAESVLNIAKDRVERLVTSLKERLETEFKPDKIKAFCTADPDFALNNNTIGKDIVDNAATAMDVLKRMESEFADNAEWSQLEDTLKSAQDGSQTVSDSLTPIEMTDWQALIVLLPYTIVPSLLIAATIMAYFDVTFAWFSCLLNWFLVPVFILMTWLMCLFTSLMAIAAGVNSDFCLPGGNVETSSPDETVISILQQQGFGNDTMEYKVSKYYIEQCIDPAKDPLAEVKSYLQYINSKERVIQQLADQLSDEGNVAQLSLHCNRNFDGVDLLVQNVLDLFRLTLASVERIMDLLSCERIVPLYTMSVYQGTCQYSSKAVYWIYWSTLVMAVMGMLMITLRSSYKRSKYDYDPDYQDNDYVGKSQKGNNNDPSYYDDDQDGTNYQENTNRGSQHYDDYDDGVQELPPQSPPSAKRQLRGVRPARDDDFDHARGHREEDAVSAYPDATSQLPMEEAAANRNRNSPHHDCPKHHDVGVYDASIPGVEAYPASDDRGGARGGGPPPSQYQRFDETTRDTNTSLADSSGTAHFSVSSNQDDDDIHNHRNNSQEDDVTFDEGDFNTSNNVYAGYDRSRRMSEDPPEGANYR